MVDLGIDKLLLIGGVALVVIGPERLPRVARTVGHLMGKAQRYVADVKAEVNRSIELEELRKVKTQFEDAARKVEKDVNEQVQEANRGMNETFGQLSDTSKGADSSGSTIEPVIPADSWHAGESLAEPPLAYRPPKKNWRLKRGAVPQWYKQRHGVRSKAQSGAARVARFRPPRPASGRP